MLSLKKSSIFFSKINKFYVNLFKNDIFAIYNFHGSFSHNFENILPFIDLTKFNYILMSSSLINLIFVKNQINFLKFISSLSFVCFFTNFNSLLVFQYKLSNFFLIAVSYKFFFFSINFLNNFFFNLLNLVDLIFFFFNYIYFFCKFLYFYIFFLRVFLI